MASPLTAALKPLVSADDDANIKYQNALERIEAALTAREQGGGFNPVLLAMAQGFLAPTKTGSFGESLGQAAGAVLPVQQQLQKEAMDNAQMRLQLAQAQREQARKAKGMEFLQGRSSGAPTTAPTTPQTGDESGPAVPTSQGPLTPAQIAKIMYADPELGKALEAEYKLNLESVAVQTGGAYNKITKQYEPFGGKAPVTRFIPADPNTNRPAMNLDMTEQDAILLDNARTQGDYDAYKKVVDRYITMPTPKVSKEAQTSVPSGESLVKPLPTPQSVASNQPMTAQDLKQQQDIETATAKAESEALAKERAARTSAKINAASDAQSRAQASQIIQELFKGEGMDQVTGVLEKPGFLPAVLKMAEEGVNLGRGYSISVPQIRDIFTTNKINLPKIQGETRQQYDARVNNVIDKLQQASSLFAQITFGMRSLAKGQGSISNFEQEIFNRMGPTTKDSLATILAKSKHMEERANFDQAVANGLINSNMPFDKFSQTPEYRNMVKDYDTKIKSIYAGVPLGGTTQPASSTVKPTTSKPAGNVNPEAARKLRDLLNTPPR